MEGLYFWENLPKALTTEQNLELFKQYKQTGDKGIRDKICYGNLKLVLEVAKDWNNLLNKECQQYPTVEDLYEIGAMSLLKSIEKFDLNKKIAFSTFATNVIKNEYGMFFRRLKLDKRIPSNLVDSFEKPVMSKDENLKQEDQIATGGQIEDEIISLIEKPLTDERSEGVKNAMERLSDRNKRLIEDYYFKGKEESEIAKDEGVSERTIALRITKAKKQLKRILDIEQKGLVINTNPEVYKLLKEIPFVNAEVLKTAVEKLKPNYKKVVEDYYINCKTQYEIAEDEGVSQPTIARRIKTAKRQLKTILEEDCFEK